MAEELDDGEFWLPSQFLTDDDILSDFINSDVFGSGSGSSFIETESSDDDDQPLLSGLSRHFSQSSLDCPVHSKGWVLSSSPQSTLFGCECKGSSSSLGSPTGPVSPPKEEAKGGDTDEMKKNKNETLDLLNKAAGEVAKMKMRTESGRSTVGTGFFDCSNSAKGLLCPPPPQPPTIPTHFPPFYSRHHFHHFAPMMWGPVQYPPPPQNKPTTNNKTNTTNGRPLGLPPSAWPPLPVQPQAKPQSQAQPKPTPPQPQPMMGMFVGQPGQKGTGVFLPRRVTTTTETKKNSDGNAKKTKTKGSQRRSSRTPKAIEDEIQLPPEWVY